MAPKRAAKASGSAKAPAAPATKPGSRQGNASTRSTKQSGLKKNLAKDVEEVSDDLLDAEMPSEPGQDHPSDVDSADESSSASEEEEKAHQPSASHQQPKRGGGRRAGGSKAGQALPTKRSYAEMLGSSVDDASLRAVYRSLPGQRIAERAELHEQLIAKAGQWHVMLRAGFSVLLHGVGSKREVLQQVAEEQLTDGAVVVCNGFIKSITAHKVLAAVGQALLGRCCRTVGSSELVSLIKAEHRDCPHRRVYLVLHNIDGPGLRNEQEQAALAALAACPNVHVLASTDHVNAALMWSPATATLFRWLWVTAHTYCPLVAETLDKPSVLLGCYQRSRQRGAGAVLRSMVAGARDVFSLLVAAQVEDPELEGLDFKQLFRMCREQFLLTSESALRSALTEFKDHELLATRQSSDGGGELLYVPLDPAGLANLAQEIEAIRAEAA